MQKDKIKVVWICEFSNENVRKRLSFRFYSPLFILGKLRNRIIFRDLSQWITNGIQEFKKIDNIELHVISSHPYLLKKIQAFKEDNVYFHFFKSENDNFLTSLRRKFLPTKLKTNYKKNSHLIHKIIENINPDIIHLIGAELPYISSSVLSLNSKRPLLVTLQTLMSDPKFYENYPIDKESYDFRCAIEKKVIRRADYIGTSVLKFAKEIKQSIKNDAIFIPCRLAVAEPFHIEISEKQYDFVYFSKEIEKAADWAIEAFAIANKSNPQMTLLIVGGYSRVFKEQLDYKILEYGLTDKITFTGSLPTHEDVIKKIKKAKYALIPLKIDLISGTIREAMACGLPVITTRTPSTPDLNAKRECILIAEPADFQDIANKMLLLYNKPDYTNRLVKNSFITLNERYNNTLAMQGWVDAYKAICQNYYYNVPIPNKLIFNIEK